MFDVLIRGGRVADGTGREAYPADVGIKGDKIAAIGDLTRLSAAKELDASGLVVSPGFIDIHAHSDTMFLKDDSSASRLYQGVTTEVSGNCGESPFPVFPEIFEKSCWESSSYEHFLRRFEDENRKMGVNQAMLVGHGTLRQAAAGLADRPVSADEMKMMERLLEESLEQGAFGMSLGLEYAPGFFAGTQELANLAKIAARYDALVPCHMRSEGLHIDEAIDELLEIGRSSGAHVHISHLKIDHYSVHGIAPRIWEKVQRAGEDGIRVSADMYPYTASSTTLSIRCPKWSQEGGADALTRRLKGSEREKIVEGIRSHYFNAERAKTCLVCSDAGRWPEIVGHTLKEIAEDMLGTEDYAEAAAQILERTESRAWCVFFVMSEEDMLYFLSQDIGIGSDGRSLSVDPAKVPYKPHPRYYGAVSEFFRLAREKKLCSLEEAVRRVTSKPADILGMKTRGRLKEGFAADITVFDSNKIAPGATYLDPVQPSCGVHHVLIGGRLAMENEKQTDLRAGKFLRKGQC